MHPFHHAAATPGKPAIILASTASTLLFLAALVILFQTFPRSVVTIEWLLCIVVVGGARFAYRVFTADQRPVLSVGSGMLEAVISAIPTISTPMLE